MTKLFSNRREAGRQLAKALSTYRGRDDVIVLALPRGGVPVAFEIAEALRAPLDLMLVRKLGAPGEEELAMGAIAMPDIAVFNDDVIRNVSISQEYLDHVVTNERRELARRNRLYRGGEPPPDIEDHVVILVDDGAATGANMRAAAAAVARQKPLRIVIAVPAAPRETLAAFKKLADEVICLNTPRLFFAVGQVYQDFSPVEDENVLSLLDAARAWDKERTQVSGNHRRAC